MQGNLPLQEWGISFATLYYLDPILIGKKHIGGFGVGMMWFLLMIFLLGPAVMGLYVVVLVLHEFAHLLAAKFIDKHGHYIITLGQGKELAKLCFLRTTVRLHMIPYGGGCWGKSSRPWLLWERLLFMSAGLLLNLMLAAASFFVVHVRLTGSAASFSLAHMLSGPLLFLGGRRDYLEALQISDHLVYLFGAMNALALWTGLIPLRLGGQMNDGLSIVHLIRSSHAEKPARNRTELRE